MENQIDWICVLEWASQISLFPLINIIGDFSKVVCAIDVWSLGTKTVCECQSWLQCLPQQTHVVMTSVFYKGMTHKSHHMFLTMTLQHGDKLAITTDMWNSHQIQQPRRCRARLWWGKQTSPFSPSGFSQGGQHRTWFGISPPTCNHTQPWAYAMWRVEM